ncbi:MAG: PucC family protein, partial [Chloroflexota bacterium]
VLSSNLYSLNIFYTGIVLLGFATGLSTVSNLSLMLDMTTAGRIGLFIGAWGMAEATSRLVGSMISGIVRDISSNILNNQIAGYRIVFIIEIFMLLASLIILKRIDVTLFQKEYEHEVSTLEKVALAREG